MLNRYLIDDLQISYQEINQAVFGCGYIKQVSVGDKELKMSDSDFGRLLYLFLLCKTMGVLD